MNKYPSQRVFTAIGVGGDGFKASMLKAVEDVVGTVHLECVSERPSSGGKYVSIRVGPVWVESADQVSRHRQGQGGQGGWCTQVACTMCSPCAVLATFRSCQQVSRLSSL